MLFESFRRLGALTKSFIFAFILNRICKSHPESKYQVEDSIAETQEEWGHG